MSVGGTYWICKCGEEVTWTEAAFLNVKEDGEEYEVVMCPHCDRKRKVVEAL